MPSCYKALSHESGKAELKDRTKMHSQVSQFVVHSHVDVAVVVDAVAVLTYRLRRLTHVLLRLGSGAVVECEAVSFRCWYCASTEEDRILQLLPSVFPWDWMQMIQVEKIRQENHMIHEKSPPPDACIHNESHVLPLVFLVLLVSHLLLQFPIPFCTPVPSVAFLVCYGVLRYWSLDCSCWS